MTKEEVKEKITKMIMEEYDLRPSQAKKDIEVFLKIWIKNTLYHMKCAKVIVN